MILVSEKMFLLYLFFVYAVDFFIACASDKQNDILINFCDFRASLEDLPTFDFLTTYSSSIEAIWIAISEIIFSDQTNYRLQNFAKIIQNSSCIVSWKNRVSDFCLTSFLRSKLIREVAFFLLLLPL